MNLESENCYSEIISDVRKYIRQNGSDNYERAVSSEQNLTFDYVAETFKTHGVDLDENIFRAFGSTQNDIYTNLALLFSDQCKHTTKIAEFTDEACTEFRDSKEFSGSVLKQFVDAATYLTLCNRRASIIEEGVRIDMWDYPPEAIREALLNALVHRDYSFSGSIIININESKMEFISLGGLLLGLSTDDIRLGISQPRNKMLAEVFHRLKLIESYGTGIRRIYKLYGGCPYQPTIETTTSAFKITLPNMSANTPENLEKQVTPQMKKVLSYIEEREKVSPKEIEELLNVKQTRAYLITKEMLDLNLIIARGRGQSKKFYLK